MGTATLSVTDWQRVLEFYTNMLYPKDWDDKGEAKSPVDRRIIAELKKTQA